MKNKTNNHLFLLLLLLCTSVLWSQDCTVSLPISGNIEFLESEVFEFVEEESLVFDEENNVFFSSSGDNIVFNYRLLLGRISETNGQTSFFLNEESISFEIDSSMNEFSFSDQELATTNANYRAGPTLDSPSFLIEQGTISGNRIDEQSWDISIDIIITTDFWETPLNIDGIFMAPEETFID